MLRQIVEKYLKDQKTIPDTEEKTGPDVDEKMGCIIKLAEQTSDPSFLESYLGSNPYLNYLPDDFALSVAVSEGKATESEFWCKRLTTTFLELGFAYACKQGNLKLVKYFVEQQHLSPDLQIDSMSHQKFLVDNDQVLKGTPLRIAAENGCLDIVRYFIEERKATLDAGSNLRSYESPLMKAALSGHNRVVAYLLRAGANIDEKSSFLNITPLRGAIQGKHVDTITLLVAAKANVSSSDVNYAISSNMDLDTIKLLMDSCNEPENVIHSYYIAAIESGNIATLKYFEDRATTIPDEHAMLLAAAYSGSVAMMRYLVEVKKLELKKYVSDENMRLDPNSKDGPVFKGSLFSQSIQQRTWQIKKAGFSILNAAASRPNCVPLLRYIIEENNLRPSDASLMALSENVSERNKQAAVAYLSSLMTKHEKKTLRLT